MNGEAVQVRFHVLLQEKILKQLTSAAAAGEFNFSKESLALVHNVISTEVKDVFSKMKTTTVSGLATDWLINQLFKSIIINGEKIGEVIVMNDYDISSLPKKDVVLFSKLFNDTQIGADLKNELARREKDEKAKAS